MAEFIYVVQKVRKTASDKLILDDVTLAFFPGAKTGVVDPGGAGKSTLLKTMTGLEQPNNGGANLVKGASAGILLQGPPLTEGKTVQKNVEKVVADIKTKIKHFDGIGTEMAEPDADFSSPMAEIGNLQMGPDAHNAWDIDARLEQTMNTLQCPSPNTVVDVLSGGKRRRVALCKLLLQQPDLLPLDEPANHLDARSVNWPEGHLKTYPGVVLAVTHDRYFLDNAAEWICGVDRGKLHPYEGDYPTYLEAKRQRLQIEGKKNAKRVKVPEKELEWVRSSPKARQTKNETRPQCYEELAVEAKRFRKIDTAEINIPPGPRLGSVVLEINGLTKGFGDRVLIGNLLFSLPRAGIVGIIGSNGVGKTALFKTITGQEEVDAGTVEIGDTVSFSYVDQNRAGINAEENVWQAVSNGLDHIKVADFKMPSRTYVASFGFRDPGQQKKVGVLSGGERNHLNLTLTLRQNGSVLLFDEPTNDLDVGTLSSLEDTLLEFPGYAVVISHDRWLLDRVATHTLTWGGEDEDGTPRQFWFEGNFADYEINRIKRLRAEAVQPHASRHRRLTCWGDG